YHRRVSLEAPVLAPNGYAATIDPEHEMISRGHPGLVREFHVGDGSKDPALPCLGGKSSGELVGQERPDRPSIALKPRRLNGHHDRCHLKLKWMLRLCHRHHLPQFSPELLAKGLLERRAERMRQWRRGVHGDQPLG